MRFLAVDTSSDWMKVALEWNEEIFSLTEKRNGRSDDLMTAIDELFKRANGSVDDLEGLGCVIGPGRFTGLRSGLAVIKAIAFAKSLKIAAVPYAECVKVDAPTVLLRKARKGWWYFSEFDGEKWSYSLKSDDSLQKIGKDFTVISEVPLKITAKVRKPLFEAAEMLETLKEAFKTGKIYDHVELKPFYVQRPIAEEKLLKKRREK